MRMYIYNQDSYSFRNSRQVLENAREKPLCVQVPFSWPDPWAKGFHVVGKEHNQNQPKGFLNLLSRRHHGSLKSGISPLSQSCCWHQGQGNVGTSPFLQPISDQSKTQGAGIFTLCSPDLSRSCRLVQEKELSCLCFSPLHLLSPSPRHPQEIPQSL